MNNKCKYCDYVSKCSKKCEYVSILCLINRSFPKVVDKSYEDLLQENQQLKEQLFQRDSIIEKAIIKLGRYADEMISNGNAYAVCVDILDILKRYKKNGDEK